MKSPTSPTTGAPGRGMCPDAVPLWKQCNERKLVLLLWEDKLAACFSCAHYNYYYSRMQVT